MTAYAGAFQRLALTVAGAYGTISFLFLAISKDVSAYQLLAIYDKVLVYLLTPLFLLLSCRGEAVMKPLLVIRQGSRRRALAARLFLHVMCAVFCTLLWLVFTNLWAVLRYRTVLDSSSILRYAPLWLLLVELAVLMGRFFPPKAAILSHGVAYLFFTVELLSLSRLLPGKIGLLFSWFYQGQGVGIAALCVWCIILAVILARLYNREDILA